ncbi:proton atpase, partial [Cystoisospora suis]
MTPGVVWEADAPSSWRGPFACFRRLWSRRKNRKSEYVFFLTNYDSHADGAIRESLLDRMASPVPASNETVLSLGPGPSANTQQSQSQDHPDAEAPSQCCSLATPAGRRGSRTSAAGSALPHPHSFPDSRVSFLRGVRPDNEIHTAKYSYVTFLPLVLFYQLTRFSNFYFLCVAMLQLVPPISDSGGVPTYLIPISIIVGLAIVKEFFEDYSRHRSDEEENSKEVLLFENGNLVSKQWRDVRVGDVVKITAGQQFPADLVLLNCSHDFGICNVETKNVDGESNVKSRFCVPQLTRIFADDEAAGKAKVRFICEPACDNLTSFSGKVILPSLTDRQQEESSRKRRKGRRNRPKRSTLARQKGERAAEGQGGGDHKSEESKAHPVEGAGIGQESDGIATLGTASPTPRRHVGFSPGLSDQGRSSTGDDALIEEEWSGEEMPGEESDADDLKHDEFVPAEIVDRQALEKEGNPERCLTNRRREEIGEKRGRRKRGGRGDEGEMEERDEEIALSFKQLLLRGTSMVETKWAYGAVVYSGKQTRLMMNGRVGSLQKWSRLELNYSSHVVVMIVVQVLSVLLLSFMSIYWIETQGYQAAYLDLRHYISTIQNFGITFGATFLVFASFVPIDIFMLWEICRFVQGLFINFDDQMYCAETQKHARSQAAQLIEEMGNVTHIYSDKTGTLTKNLMQLKCVGLGDGFEYGMDRWCDERASMNVLDRKFQKQMHLLKTEATRRSALSRRLSARASPSPSFLSAPWPDPSISGAGAFETCGCTTLPPRVSSTFVPGGAPGSDSVALCQQLPAGASASPAAFGAPVPLPRQPQGSPCCASLARRRQMQVDKVVESCPPASRSSEHAQAAPERRKQGTNFEPDTERNGEKLLLGHPRDTGRVSDCLEGGASRSVFPSSAVSAGIACPHGASTAEAGVVEKGNRDAHATDGIRDCSPGTNNQSLPAVTSPVFLRGANSFVSLDRLELTCSLLRAPADVLDRTRHLFLVMGLCHTVLV